MKKNEQEVGIDPEILAANILSETMDALPQEARIRIFKWAKDRYNL